MLDPEVSVAVPPQPRQLGELAVSKGKGWGDGEQVEPGVRSLGFDPSCASCRLGAARSFSWASAFSLQ